MSSDVGCASVPMASCTCRVKMHQQCNAVSSCLKTATDVSALLGVGREPILLLERQKVIQPFECKDWLSTDQHVLRAPAGLTGGRTRHIALQIHSSAAPDALPQIAYWRSSQLRLAPPLSLQQSAPDSASGYAPVPQSPYQLCNVLLHRLHGIDTLYCSHYSTKCLEV